jgi:hypothetical protein
MTLTLSLPPDTEAQLRQRAAAAGKDITTFVREAVEEKLAVPATMAARTPQQWKAEFNAWVAGQKPLPHVADDSRESIYAGRGE